MACNAGTLRDARHQLGVLAAQLVELFAKLLDGLRGSRKGSSRADDASHSETARRMRAEHRPELRLVALTGWGQAEDRRRARDVGFDAHLVEPVDMDAVEALLVAPEASPATG